MINSDSETEVFISESNIEVVISDSDDCGDPLADSVLGLPAVLSTGQARLSDSDSEGALMPARRSTGSAAKRKQLDSSDSEPDAKRAAGSSTRRLVPSDSDSESEGEFRPMGRTSPVSGKKVSPVPRGKGKQCEGQPMNAGHASHKHPEYVQGSTAGFKVQNRKKTRRIEMSEVSSGDDCDDACSVAKKKKPRTAGLSKSVDTMVTSVPYATPEQNTVFDPSDPAQLVLAVAFWEMWGYLIVKIVDDKTNDNLLHKIFSMILYGHHYKPEHRMVLKDKDGNIVTPDMREAFIALIKHPDTFAAKSENLANALRAYGPHRDFGAPMPPGSVQCEELWRIRGSVAYYAISRILSGRKRLWSDLNRFYLRFKMDSSSQFWHIDGPRFTSADRLAAKAAADAVKQDERSGRKPRKKKPSTPALTKNGRSCAKYCCLPDFFVANPGTHKEEWQEKLYASCIATGIYPFKVGQPMLAFDPAKPDPMGIGAGMVKLKIAAGNVIIWHDRLVHAKLPQEGVGAGCFLGVSEAVSHPAYKVRCGVDELEDRKRSRADGLFPLIFPSGGKTSHNHQGMPFKFFNFPKHMNSYYDKLLAVVNGVPNPELTTHVSAARTKRKQKEWMDAGRPDWEQAVYLEKSVCLVTPHDYKPPVLTELEMKLDGQMPWSDSEGE